LNKSGSFEPALNAYIFTKNMTRVKFLQVKGQPKVEAIIVVKGEDSIGMLNKILDFVDKFLHYE
jgi:hypothetical protein